MAICPECELEMLEADGCRVGRFSDFEDGVVRQRVRWGRENHQGLRQALAFEPGQTDRPQPLAEDDPRYLKAAKLYGIGPFFDGRRCPDCNCLPDSYHHVGCDQEECPRCHYQALGCRCLDWITEKAENESGAE